MKKRILTGITALSLTIFLTGCGSNTKKLTCTQSSDSNGFKSEIKQEYKLKDNKVTKMTETRKVTLEGDMTQYLEEHLTSAQNTIDQYKDVKGISVKKSDTSNSVTVVIEYDAKNLASEYRDSVNIEESYESLKDIKAEQGYSCK